jgi:hypothetical protein
MSHVMSHDVPTLPTAHAAVTVTLAVAPTALQNAAVHRHVGAHAALPPRLPRTFSQ